MNSGAQQEGAPHGAPVAAPAPPGRIRLLVNALHSRSGGGVTYLRNMLPLMARDPEIDLHLCIQDDQRSLLPKGIDNLTVHAPRRRLGFWRVLLWEQFALPGLARRIGADVTYSPANYGPILAPNAVVLIRNALGVAFVERRPAKLAYWAAVFAATMLSLLRCSRALAVSEYARRTVTSGLMRRRRERIHVVPHGVDPLFGPPPDDRAREDFLLAVSDIYVQKNLTNLLLSIARLRPDHPGIKLKIAGSFIDADYHATLERLVAEHDLTGHVEFLGHVSPENLVGLYRRCRAFVFPSLIETFGNPLVEAMASGAPIASSDTAAMPEVVGEAGLFFDPTDVGAIAMAIDRLIRDPDMRADLSRRALERAKAFTWEATAERTLAVIKAAAAER